MRPTAVDACATPCTTGTPWRCGTKSGSTGAGVMLLVCTRKSTRAIRSKPGLTATARKVLKGVRTLCPRAGTGRTKRSSMPHRTRSAAARSKPALHAKVPRKPR